ncbi:unnamed protein product [Diatraea saccharalis]|uniref:Tudor domain-containing protein n=1 Tax=Diatraea saccharalis TaxID=40085 RepID=A0A9N9QW46_9NEOP|nr:unnamed protein product [Diatraea saccharalis]
MNIVITTFKDPFSFFCLSEQNGKDIDFIENCVEPSNFPYSSKIEVADVCHGQYVAVMWKNKWVRGLVTMESQFLIWLIDYGCYLRPNDKTVYTELPSEFKKFPTKVFEASIHGVAPVDRQMTDDCEIKNEIATTWTAGAIEKAQTLIANASKIYFVPIALMSTKANDIVIGDLYLVLGHERVVNIVDELQLWPVFLEKNKSAYIENLLNNYTSRRKHRACLLKPALPNSEIPTMTFDTTLEEYDAICAAAPQFETAQECSDVSEEGSTVVDYVQNKTEKDVCKLTAAEIEKYSHTYVSFAGQKYNVLNVLCNKIRDLKICEKYKDHDLKSVGRASYRIPPPWRTNFYFENNLN